MYRPMTEVNFEGISSYERYKLMASLIVPRPIALVTTLGANGVVNAASSFIILRDMLMESKKTNVIFLTGTPMMNNPFEMVPCINILAGR